MMFSFCLFFFGFDSPETERSSGSSSGSSSIVLLWSSEFLPTRGWHIWWHDAIVNSRCAASIILVWLVDYFRLEASNLKIWDVHICRFFSSFFSRKNEKNCVSSSSGKVCSCLLLHPSAGRTKQNKTAEMWRTHTSSTASVPADSSRRKRFWNMFILCCFDEKQKTCKRTVEGSSFKVGLRENCSGTHSFMLTKGKKCFWNIFMFWCLDEKQKNKKACKWTEGKEVLSRTRDGPAHHQQPQQQHHHYVLKYNNIL